MSIRKEGRLERTRGFWSVCVIAVLSAVFGYMVVFGSGSLAASAASTTANEIVIRPQANVSGGTIPALSLAPSRPSTLFVEYEGRGVLVSHDSGDDWTDLGYFLGCGNVCGLVVNPVNPDVILALEGSG